MPITTPALTNVLNQIKDTSAENTYASSGVSRSMAVPLVLTEGATLLNNAKDLFGEVLIRFLVLPATSCVSYTNERAKKWNADTNVTERFIIVCKLIAGLISSIFLSWSFPATNEQMHQYLGFMNELSAKEKIAKQQKTVAEHDETYQATAKALSELEGIIAATSQPIDQSKPLDKRVAAIRDNLISLHETNHGISDDLASDEGEKKSNKSASPELVAKAKEIEQSVVNTLAQKLNIRDASPDMNVIVLKFQTAEQERQRLEAENKRLKEESEKKAAAEKPKEAPKSTGYWPFS